MSAQIEAITDAEIHHVRNNGEWAMFILRHWQRVKDPLQRGTGGSLTVHSSYGTFSYIWGSTGSSFKEFLVEHLAKDWHYTMKKFLQEGNAMYEFSLEETQKEMRRVLVETRREDGREVNAAVAALAARNNDRLGYMTTARYTREQVDRMLTKEKAAELWSEIDRCMSKEDCIATLMSDDGHAAWGDEAYELIRKVPCGWIEYFWSELFLPYAEHIKASLAKEPRKK